MPARYQARFRYLFNCERPDARAFASLPVVVARGVVAENGVAVVELAAEVPEGLRISASCVWTRAASQVALETDGASSLSGKACRTGSASRSCSAATPDKAWACAAPDSRRNASSPSTVGR